MITYIWSDDNFKHLLFLCQQKQTVALQNEFLLEFPVGKAADFTYCHVPACCAVDQAHIRAASYVQIEVSISYHISTSRIL
jgi:hypothetical protein